MSAHQKRHSNSNLSYYDSVPNKVGSATVKHSMTVHAKMERAATSPSTDNSSQWKGQHPAPPPMTVQPLERTAPGHSTNSQLVTWCFEPSQPQKITSGLKMNFNPSLR